MDVIAVSLQEKLVVLRKAQKLSQDDIAEQLNVTRQAISRWESGKSVPSTENLIAIAALFQVPLHFLVDNEASFEGSLIVESVPTEARLKEKPTSPRKAVSWIPLQAGLGLCILILLLFTTLGVHTLLARGADDSRLLALVNTLHLFGNLLVERRCRCERYSAQVVDELHVDLLVAPEHGHTRSVCGSAHFFTDTHLNPVAPFYLTY